MFKSQNHQSIINHQFINSSIHQFISSSVRLRIHISQNPNLLLVTRVSVGVMKYLIDIPVQRVPQNWTMNLIFYVLVSNESPVGTSSIPWRVRIPVGNFVEPRRCVYTSFKCCDTVGRNRQSLEATSEAPSDKRPSLGGGGLGGVSSQFLFLLHKRIWSDVLWIDSVELSFSAACESVWKGVCVSHIFKADELKRRSARRFQLLLHV